MSETPGPWKKSKDDEGRWVVRHTDGTYWGVETYVKDKAEALEESLNDLFREGFAAHQADLEAKVKELETARYEETDLLGKSENVRVSRQLLTEWQAKVKRLEGEREKLIELGQEAVNYGECKCGLPDGGPVCAACELGQYIAALEAK